jgi:hypothetical protein
MSIRSRKEMFVGSKAHPVRKADKLTGICESIVDAMFGHQCLTSLNISRTCYGDRFFNLLSTFCISLGNVFDHHKFQNIAIDSTALSLLFRMYFIVKQKNNENHGSQLFVYAV